MTKPIQAPGQGEENGNADTRPRLEPGGDDDAWQQSDENSLPTALPDDVEDEVAQQASLSGDEDVPDGESPSTEAVPLTAENIGLGRVAGINEAEVGRELNVEGDQDNDEDDDGNPIDPVKAVQP